MQTRRNPVLLLLFLCLFSGPGFADSYVEASTGWVYVDTPSATARPVLLDLRIGVEHQKHQFELALMSSVKEDRINRLSVETPSVISLLWHYIPEQQSSLKFQTILGASVVEVDADLPDLGSSNEEYYGISFGVGFEERFASIPQLKLSIDLMNLYHGDDLDIFAATLGVHYDF